MANIEYKKVGDLGIIVSNKKIAAIANAISASFASRFSIFALVAFKSSIDAFLATKFSILAFSASRFSILALLSEHTS